MAIITTSGQTLQEIADAYNMDVEQLIALQAENNPDFSLPATQLRGQPLEGVTIYVPDAQVPTLEGIEQEDSSAPVQQIQRQFGQQGEASIEQSSLESNVDLSTPGLIFSQTLGLTVMGATTEYQSAMMASQYAQMSGQIVGGKELAATSTVSLPVGGFALATVGFVWLPVMYAQAHPEMAERVKQDVIDNPGARAQEYAWFKMAGHID